MSKFVLRSFEKLIPQSNFNKPHNKFLLSFRNLVLSPTQYYYNPKLATLPQGQPFDVFQLSNIAYDLVRERVHLEHLISQIEKANLSSNSQMLEFREFLLKQSHDNLVSGNSYISELQSQISTNTFELTASDCANFVYAAVHSGSANPEFLKKFIYPQLAQKFEYLSLQNCLDLFNSLVQLKVQDKDLLQKLLNKIQSKQFSHEYVHTEFFESQVDSFQKAGTSKQSVSEFQRTFNDLKSGQGFAFTKFKIIHQLGPLFNKAFNFVYLRENRVERTFTPHNPQEEFEKFVDNLKALQQSQPELKTKEFLEALQKRKSQQ